MDGNWVCEPQAHIIENYFRLSAIYHTAIPDVDERNMKISNEVKQHLLLLQEKLVLNSTKGTQTSVMVREYNSKTGRKVERVHTVLNVLQFNSVTKRDVYDSKK
jgi:phospholipid-translocating ATPase